MRKIARHFEQSDSLKHALLHTDSKEAQAAPDAAQVEEYLTQRNAEIASAIALTSPWQSRMNDRGQNPDLPSH